MDRTLIAIVVGLIAGAGGGFIGGMLMPASRVASATDAGSTRDVEARLDGIEEALRGLRSRRPALQGSGDAATDAAGPMRDGGEDALIAQLEERMRSVMKDTLKETWAELKEEDSLLASVGGNATEEPKQKKVMPFAEVAAELGLSAEEEAGVRRLTNELVEGVFEILAGDDGDIEAIKQDFLDAKGDKDAQRKLMGKYIAPAMNRLGELRTRAIAIMARCGISA